MRLLFAEVNTLAENFAHIPAISKKSVARILFTNVT